MIRRGTIFLIALFFIISTVFSYQIQLAGLNFNTISLSESQKKECQTISYDFSDLSETGEVVLSLQANFQAIKGDNSFVSVQLNDGEERIIWPEFFSCDKACWARIFLPKTRAKKTDLTLCLATGGLIQTAQLFDSSIIGLYDTPVLSIETIAPEAIILGERAKMSIWIKNEGTKKTDLFSQFVSQDIRALIDITSFDIVEGESSVSTEINAGETKEFVYYIKPNKAGTYNLPYAMLRFTNVFDEEQTITSNHTQLKVLVPEQISISVTSTELTKNSLKITALVKNNWDTHFDGEITFKPTDLVVSQTKEISLAPEAEREILAYTQQLLPGQYDFSAVVEGIKDKNNQYFSNSISYPVKKEEIPFSIVFALIAVVAAAAVFIGISYWKGKKK